MRSIWLRLTVELGSVNRRGALPRPFRPAGFATTASTLTGPVFEYRRHQSCSATAGPLDGHQEPAIAPKADVELSPLLLAGEGVEGYRHDKRSPATMK
jgi:hypothetical protein